SGSLAEIEATSATALLSSTGRASSLMRATAASTALSMPRFRATGPGRAAPLRRPSRTIAWPSTVAVVVPSPVISLVLLAISIRSLAPMFSIGSLSSMSLATVTPSLVIVGPPNFFSRTTLRPLGPSVTLTALATELTPRSRARRASSLKIRSLAMFSPVLGWDQVAGGLLEDGVDVALAQDHQLLAAELHLGAAVLGEQHGVADLDLHRLALAAVEQLAAT